MPLGVIVILKETLGLFLLDPLKVLIEGYLKESFSDRTCVFSIKNNSYSLSSFGRKISFFL